MRCSIGNKQDTSRKSPPVLRMGKLAAGSRSNNAAMVTAIFRFHAELNDFLPAARRDRALQVECSRAATTKHMVEAQGLPHMQVGVLTVNGIEAEMTRQLAHSDMVDAYPDSPAPDGPPRFVADAH